MSNEAWSLQSFKRESASFKGFFINFDGLNSGSFSKFQQGKVDDFSTLAIIFFTYSSISDYFSWLLTGKNPFIYAQLVKDWTSSHSWLIKWFGYCNFWETRWRYVSFSSSLNCSSFFLKLIPRLGLKLSIQLLFTTGTDKNYPSSYKVTHLFAFIKLGGLKINKWELSSLEPTLDFQLFRSF